MNRTVAAWTRLAGGALLINLVAVSAALAGKPTLDTGVDLSNDTPYATSQELPDPFSDSAAYGKLEGEAPIDIYRFKPAQEGEQTVTLLVPDDTAETAEPVLILVDPTDATEAQPLQLPLPSENYHAAIVTGLQVPPAYREGYLFQNFKAVAQQKLALKKDTEYYLVVVDPARLTTRYAVKFGTGSAWQAGDVFRHFGTWFRLQTDTYAASSPFRFDTGAFGMAVFLLGLCALCGILLVEESFAWLANRLKAAGYLLIKLQPYAKVFWWVALWFLAIGGYLYFSSVGWVGIPFVLALLFLPIFANTVYRTFSLSPRLAGLEVTKREATIPFDVRKRWFFSSLVYLFAVGAFLVFAAIYFAR